MPNFNKNGKFAVGNTISYRGGHPKGVPFTDEHKANLAKSHHGIKTFLGKKHSEETKRKMRKSALKRQHTEGWIPKSTINHLIRTSTEYRLWQKSVFTRDHWTCIFCGKKGGEIHADHIKPFCDYPELRFAIDNGRTLCKECHQKTETYGMRPKSTSRNITR